MMMRVERGVKIWAMLCPRSSKCVESSPLLWVESDADQAPGRSGRDPSLVKGHCCQPWGSRGA